jgi:two-component sensor histidine kinase
LAQRIAYNKSALQNFIRSGNRAMQASTYQDLGNLYSLDDNQYVAIQNLKQGLEIYQSIKYRPLQGLYYLLDEAYDQLGDYKQAVNYGLQALKTAMIVGDTSSQLCAIYNHIGRTYRNLGQMDKAGQYFRSALPVAARNHDNDSYDIVALNLARVLSSTGSAMEAVNLLKTFKTTSDNELIAIKYAVTMYALTQLHQFYNAESYYSKVQSSLLKLDKRSNVKEIVNNDILSYLYLKKDFTGVRRAIYDLEDASNFPVSKKTHILDQHWLFRVDSAQGKYLSAIRHGQVEKKLQDSLVNAEKDKYISALEIEYETGNKIRELKLKNQAILLLVKQSELQKTSLQKASLLRNVIVTGVIMLLLLLIISYNRYQLKQKSNVKLQEQQVLINNKNSSLVHLVNDKDKLICEKEWLLKEIHHRVKNNLQIVISLLNSQTVYLKNSDALEAILDSQHRVNSISLIHQKLYQSKNLSRIDMSEYIGDLVAYLKQSFGTNSNIEMIIDVEPLDLDVSLAVPIGLILNEAITNAIKYAFPAEKAGKIKIVLDEPVPGTLFLSIADNGCGLPAGLEPDKCNSLGMSLMQGLSRQLNGRLEIINNKGLKLNIMIADQMIPGGINLT